MSIHVPNLGHKKPTLQMEREKLEKDQAEAIAKATSPVETAVKEKHIRSAIIGTWQDKGAGIFWTCLGKMPLPSQVIMCWKAMFLVHKLLREGHPQALVDSFRYKKLLTDMNQFWQHSPKGGYGVLISYYLKVLIAKLDFHEKNSFIPGTLKSPSGGNIQYASTNNDDYFQLAVELFDYMDTLIELEKKIFATLDRYKSNSQIQAVQCRICPFPVIVQECSGLYTIAVDLMDRLHAGLPDEVLIGHRDRFYQHFKELKSFYFDAGNMAYVKSLCIVPSLPENPPVFTASASTTVLKRSSSYEAPKAEKPKSYDPKRQSLMEPLTVAMAEPLFNASPPDALFDFDGPPPPPRSESLYDERDAIIAQLQQEIDDLKRELGTQRAYADTMEESLKSEILRLEEELAEYRRISEQNSEENAMLRRELEVREEDKKGSGSSEEKFTKIKAMYSKLREEHIQLLRGNAEVKQKLSTSEKAKVESAKKAETLQQELDEKASQLLEVYQKADMFEQRNKEAEEIIETLTNDHEIKVTGLSAELDRLTKTKQEQEQARKDAEETIEKERKESELKVTALSEEVSSLSLIKGETELAKQTTEENLVKERSEKEQKISALSSEMSDLSRKVQETEEAKLLAEKTIEDIRKELEDKVSSLTNELQTITRLRQEQEEARTAAEQTIQQERTEHETKLAEHTRSRDEDEVKGIHGLVVSSIDEAKRVIQDSLDQFDNPHHSSTTCTADYLLSRLQGTPENLDHLVTTFKSYQTNHRDAAPFMTCLTSFSHHLGECLVNAKATSHMAPPKETEELTLHSESAGKISLDLLEDMKNSDIDPQALSDKVHNLRKHIDGLFTVAKELAPKEKDSADAISNAVDEEINATAELVADAAARIEEMLNKTREKFSGVELEVNGRILDSCTALMQAIKVLILKSKDLQEEIVCDGKGTATAKEFYKRHHRWTEGLISAAKAVGWGAKVLVDSADKVVLGKGKFEEIVVASNEITASTAQLVAASRVKAHRGSDNLSKLQVASKGVVESAAGVVASAKTGAEMIEDSKTVPDYSKLTLTQAKRYEMDSQVRLLELESDLTKEREKLGQLRRIHYQLAAAQYEDEGDASNE